MNVANLTATLNLDASGFNNNINVAITQINNLKNQAQRAQNAFQGLITTGNQISNLGRTLTFGLTVPIIGLGTEIFNVTTRMDSLRRALTAVDGSADVAARQLERLNVIARNPGIGMEEAIKGAVNLQSVGISANLAERSIKAFGNALVYSGKGKEELAGIEQILAKIAGREILSERQFTQLTMRIPRMRALLKEAFGTGDIAAIQKSGLPIENIIERIVYAAEQIPHVVGGIQNDIDNFRDHLKRAGDDIGQAMVPVVHDFTQNVGPAIENAAKWFKNLNTEQKENTLMWVGIAAVLPPIIKGFGDLVGSLGRILTLIKYIKATQFVAGGGALGLGLAVGIPTAAAYVANEANKAQDRREGKGEVNDFDVYSRVPGILWRDLKSWAFGINGKLPRGMETQAEKDSYFGNLPGADKPIVLPPKDPKAAKPAGYGHLPDPVYSAEDQRNMFRAKLQLDLERARGDINAEDTEHQAQNQLKALGPILLKQAADLKKEAADMHVSRKSTAKEWLDYYKIQGQSAQLEAEMTRMQRSATKERDKAAKATREAGYRVSEFNFNTNESNAMAIGANAPEGMQAQSTFANMYRVLKGRQQELINMWRNASRDSTNANETAVRRAQLVNEYYSVEHKGAELQKAAAEERKRNEEKVRKQYSDAQKAYREFQFDRIKAMAEEAPEGQQAEAMLNAELPRLRAEQQGIIEQQKTLAPNTAEYWRNATSYWKIEDQIHSLVKDAVKERHSAAEKAIEAQKKEAGEHRELLSLETQLMEARLKNNPLLSAVQRQSLMIPMLIRQYRQMLIPVQGETELESLRRQVDAERMKHDIMESAGALGKNASARVLGGGRLDMFNRRAIQNIMKQLDAPMSQQEQASYMTPTERAKRMAEEYGKGRPVVLQIQLPNDPSQVSREVYEALDNLNRGAAPFPTRR